MLDHERNRSKRWHSGLNGERWSVSEITYLIECGNSKTLRELSATLERSYHSVKAMRHRLCLGKRKNYRFWEKNEIDFLKSNAGKMVCRDIAKHLSRSQQSVKGKAEYMGLSLVCIGEHSPTAIHSDEDVLLCRELRTAGMSLKLIAEKMEMSLGSVLSIIYGGRMTQQDRVMLEFDLGKN
ncbi:hypothetical protein VXE42_25915 [Klebsiella oxytoca]|uniref:hypothetical protein n=1 Tax=Klebsiella oxytoca TaxID=571 RepID=UPI002E18A4B0|nr:hypothetical protein [Klebsiella oxytoca]